MLFTKLKFLRKSKASYRRSYSKLNKYLTIYSIYKFKIFTLTIYIFHIIYPLKYTPNFFYFFIFFFVFMCAVAHGISILDKFQILAEARGTLGTALRTQLGRYLDF